MNSQSIKIFQLVRDRKEQFESDLYKIDSYLEGTSGLDREKLKDKLNELEETIQNVRCNSSESIAAKLRKWLE